VAAERKRGLEFRKKYREALVQMADGDLWSLKDTAPINVISTAESVPVQPIAVAAAVQAPVASQPSQIINEFQAEQREDNSDEEFIRRRRLRRGRLVSESSVHEDDLDQEDDEIEDDEPELTESEDIDDGPAIRTRRRALFAQIRARGRLQRRTSDRLRSRYGQPANNRSIGMNLRSSRAQEEATLGKRDMAVMSQHSDEDSEEQKQ
jgi:hypothetical protein